MLIWILFFPAEIMTSTVDIKDDSRGRPVQKAKVYIFESFDKLLMLWNSSFRLMIFVLWEIAMLVAKLVTL